MKQVGPQEYLQFLDSVAAYLDQRLVSDAKNFDYGQWELPFEAVLLGLIEKNVNDIKFDYMLVKALAREASIIDEGVLDVDTWERFQSWVDSSDN